MWKRWQAILHSHPLPRLPLVPSPETSAGHTAPRSLGGCLRVALAIPKEASVPQDVLSPRAASPAHSSKAFLISNYILKIINKKPITTQPHRSPSQLRAGANARLRLLTTTPCGSAEPSLLIRGAQSWAGEDVPRRGFKGELSCQKLQCHWALRCTQLHVPPAQHPKNNACPPPLLREKSMGLVNSDQVRRDGKSRQARVEEDLNCGSSQSQDHRQSPTRNTGINDSRAALHTPCNQKRLF